MPRARTFPATRNSWPGRSRMVRPSRPGPEEEILVTRLRHPWMKFACAAAIALALLASAPAQASPGSLARSTAPAPEPELSSGFVLGFGCGLALGVAVTTGGAAIPFAIAACTAGFILDAGDAG